LYECKPYPYSGWCNGAAWAYAPGTGTYWNDAWILKGSCSGARVSTQSDQQISIADESNDLVVYPNPGSGNNPSLTLSFDSNPGKINVLLHDLNGVFIINRKYEGVKGALKVEVPSLSPGLYIIRVAGEHKSWLRKYIIR